MSRTLEDRDGNEWQPFRNQFQQRQLRYIAGPCLGQVVHDPRLGEPPNEPKRRPAQRLDPFVAGLFRRDLPIDDA